MLQFFSLFIKYTFILPFTNFDLNILLYIKCISCVDYHTHYFHNNTILVTGYSVIRFIFIVSSLSRTDTLEVET